MKTLLDTGPLVAIISKADGDHAACVAAFKTLDESPIATWAVITEAAWLLRNNLEHVETLFDYAYEGIITIADLDVAEFSSWLHRFFAKYADQQPQLADCTLMFLAEGHGIRTIFTLDRRDFGIYRTLDDGRSLTIIP